MKRITQYFRLMLIAFIAPVIFVSCYTYPPTVKTISAHYQVSATIIATGKVVSSGENGVTSYGFCLSKRPNPTISDIKIEHQVKNYYSIAEFTDSIPDIDLNTTYYLRAYAISLDGVGYGEVITVSTTSAPAVKNLAVNSITMTSAILTATVNPNNTNAENWFEYEIDGGTSQKVTVENSTGSSDALISIKVSNLIPGEKYSVVVKAKNEYGQTYSEPVTFQTYIAVDYDGNFYRGVTIGTQTWLKENLKTTHYLNGDPIPNLQDTTAWKTATTGAYVYYNNDPELGKTYGGLYNWYVTSDPRGLIKGFHVPSGHEFDTLAIFVGDYFSGIYLMEAGKSHWLNPRGTDAYGFTALPNGEYWVFPVTGIVQFTNLSQVATFWTNDSYGTSSVIAQINPSFYSMLDVGTMYLKSCGYGIRLLKN